MNGVILVDDGTGPRPALRDQRDEFDAIHDMVFGPDGLVAWTSIDENYGGRVFVGRIDENGQILDSHRVGGPLDDAWATGSFDDQGILTATTYEGDPFLLDTATDPFFVMSAEPPPKIETDTPLLTELEHEGYWAPPDRGSWYRGRALGTEPACGSSTLDKDDVDGYARVLDASTELDTVVDIDVTESFGTGGVDTVGTARSVILSTECPGEYDGRRIHWGIETIGYGDGGPRLETPLVVEPASDTPVAEVVAVTTHIPDVDCCPRPTALQVDVELLAGTRTVLEIVV